MPYERFDFRHFANAGDFGGGFTPSPALPGVHRPVRRASPRVNGPEWSATDSKIIIPFQ